MTSPYRPEFEAALRLFARVSEAAANRGLPRPVLVGGAAVEYYSGSGIVTGDFDLCSVAQPELEQIMIEHGFVRPTGSGRLTRGLIHPDLKLGFEIVGSRPMDGNVDRDHVLLVELPPDGAGFAIISVEDLIADRMGQFASGTAPFMKEQAIRLLALHADVDRDYLDSRVRFETAGDYGFDDID